MFGKNRFLILLCNSHLFVHRVGDWYSGPAANLDTEPDEEWVRSRRDESRAFQEWDEDADIDESGELGLALKLVHVVLVTDILVLIANIPVFGVFGRNLFLSLLLFKI